MYLMGFNFDIVYRSTHEHGNADALSRLPVTSEQLPEMNATDVFMLKTMEDSPLVFKDIERETMRSKELRPLLKALKGSTSSYKNQKYFGIELCEFSLHDDSVILRGHRVVVPETCRQRVLSELHEGHYGVQKMKNIARQHIWWSSLDKDIHALALRCVPCLTHARSPRRISLGWEPTTQCFQKIHLDYSGPIQGKYVLLLVDAHLKWLEASVTSRSLLLRKISRTRNSNTRRERLLRRKIPEPAG